MVRALLVLLMPLAVVLAVEGLFAAGIWEPLAEPNSHAGTSVRLKAALQDPIAAHLDFVTLGSSRPEYGLNHARIAARARDAGWVHADLSMPGSHWATVGVLADWLAREHPEIRGGIIALSIQDFTYPYNGYYELGILQPFRHIGELPWIADRIPVDPGDPASFGVLSSLFAWRDDVRAFVAHPRARLDRLAWARANRHAHDILFGNPDSQGDLCTYGAAHLSACDAVDASSDDKLKRQCREMRTLASGAAAFTAGLAAPTLPEPMARTRDRIRAVLEETRWQRPPVVVLMPMPGVWHDVIDPALHAWALRILQPLADAGRIRLIDGTGFFDADPDAGCSAFFDFYHQTANGRDRFTDWLLPQLDASLYGAYDGARAADSP